jgi:hypothetical protein
MDQAVLSLRQPWVERATFFARTTIGGCGATQAGDQLPGNAIALDGRLLAKRVKFAVSH